MWVGAEVRPQQFIGFLDSVTIMGLTDMRYTGKFLTWSNRQENHIQCKLDRVLVNVEWVGEFPDFETEFMNPEPLLISHQWWYTQCDIMMERRRALNSLTTELKKKAS